MVLVAGAPSDLLDRLAHYQPSRVEKWIDRAAT
jgi:hypothetical protein